MKFICHLSCSNLIMFIQLFLIFSTITLVVFCFRFWSNPNSANNTHQIGREENSKAQLSSISSLLRGTRSTSHCQSVCILLVFFLFLLLFNKASVAFYNWICIALQSTLPPCNILHHRLASSPRHHNHHQCRRASAYWKVVMPLRLKSLQVLNCCFFLRALLSFWS